MLRKKTEYPRSEYTFVKAQTEIIIGGFPFYFSHSKTQQHQWELNFLIQVFIIQDHPVKLPQIRLSNMSFTDIRTFITETYIIIIIV